MVKFALNKSSKINAQLYEYYPNFTPKQAKAQSGRVETDFEIKVLFGAIWGLTKKLFGNRIYTSI
jgi:hypothetical protein